MSNLLLMSDSAVLEDSTRDNMVEVNDVPFSDKSYVFITDSASSSGNYSSNQIQFDLSTLANQSKWVDLKNAYVEFPVKVSAALTTAPTNAVTASNLFTTIKNGYHQFISSAQLIINGQTIQSAQPYENVAASLRIYSSWSQDTLTKWGKTTCIAMDDCSGDSVSTLGNVNITNCKNDTVTTSVIGLDCVSNNATMHNDGVSARMTQTSIDASLTASGATQTLKNNILSVSAAKNAGNNNVGYLTSGSTTNGTTIYNSNMMATVRLKDLFDIDNLPLSKNINGYIYLTVQNTQISATVNTSTSAAVISAITYSQPSGQTCPILINRNALTSATANTGVGISITAAVNGSSDNLVAGSSAGPVLTNSRLFVAMYEANPKADLALSNPNKFFTTLEKIVNPFTVSANSSTNYTISVGIPNVKKLVLLPMLQNLGGASLANPELSAFDTVPATSGPFCILDQLQVYVANKPMYQTPVQYTFEQWASENALTGFNGGNEDVVCSGLLSQQLYEQNHSFVVCNIGRRMESEDGASKSVQVSFRNPTNYGMKVIAIVFYEKQWVMNTNTSMLQNVK